MIIKFDIVQGGHMTLFILIGVCCGTNNIIWNIPHIQPKCEKYPLE